jgi:hypothetical protein
MRLDSAGNVGIGTASPVFGAGSGVELVRSGTATYRAVSNGQGVEYRNNAGTAEIDTRGAFPIVLLTNQTERMRITAAGYTQFGADGTTSTLSITPTVTSRPSTSAPMIQTTGGGGSGVYANAGQLIISGRPTDTSTFGNIYIQTGATQQNQWIFNNGAAFVLPGGTATTTGTGITFPAAQSASSDANCLDDYEEGTWTPALNFNGASVGITYTTQQGSYTKIGRQVIVYFLISLSNKGSSVGSVRIGGLPFSASNAVNEYSFNMYLYSGFAGTVTSSTATGYLDSSTMFEFRPGNTTTNLTNADFTNNSWFWGSASYQAA